MQRFKRLFIALLVSGGILPFLSTSAQAQRYITCGPAVTISANLATAAATATRTLFVKGTCFDNVTVRNLRIIIDGQNQTTLKPLDPLKAAITFRGGTTEATILNMTIETGANPVDPSTGKACNSDGNTVKGGDGIDVRDGANVNIGQAAAFDVPAHAATGGGTIAAVSDVPVLGNTIVAKGAGRAIRVRNGASAALNGNTINGNHLTPDGLDLGTAACGGVLNKSFAGSVGIDISTAGNVTLGTKVSQTADLLVGGDVIDNRNTVAGHDKGIACATGGIVAGIKAPTSNPAGANGLSLFAANPSNTTVDTGVSVIAATAANIVSGGKIKTGDGVATPAGAATDIVECFTDL